MPLNTQVLRKGKNHKPESGWTYLGLSCFLTAAIIDADPDWEFQEGKAIGELEPGQFVDFSMAPIYYMEMDNVPLWQSKPQTLKRGYKFGPFNDPDDGEYHIVFTKGDVLSMYRD
jgi:hypothetical protein